MTDIQTYTQLRQVLEGGRALCGRDRPAVAGEYVSGFHYWIEPRDGFTVPAHRAIAWIRKGLVTRTDERPDGTLVYGLPPPKVKDDET